MNRLYLEGQGLDPNPALRPGFGKYHPIASNDASEGRAMNRRTNIVIQDQTP
jgi:chemotaxis protein MotB